MSGDIVIRTAEAGDAEIIHEIETECFEHPWSLKSIAEELENPMALLLIAETDGVAAGYISSWPVRGCECQIGNVAVKKAFRRQGAAKLLIARLADECAALDIDDISLEVRPSNEAAIALYEGLGFCEEGRRRGYYEGKEDALIMRKR